MDGLRTRASGLPLRKKEGTKMDAPVVTEDYLQELYHLLDVQEREIEVLTQIIETAGRRAIAFVEAIAA